MKFIMCKGLPGSGKSRWAEEQVLNTQAGQAVRVNRDLLRLMLHADRWKGSKTEKPTVAARDAIIKAMMVRKTALIICDDTNLAPSVEFDLRALADEGGYTFEIKDFTDVPLKTCVERDLKRDRSVGKDVIVGMHNKFLTGAPADPPEWILGAADVVLVDVDGTLARMDGRSPYEWQRVGEDAPIQPIIRLIEVLRRQGLQMVFVSGRDGSCRSETEQWLKTHAFKDHGEQLLMRPAGDTRPDSIVKREIYDASISGHYNVAWVLDDRNQVVDMWRSLGLTCLQVAPGDF